MTAPPPPRWLLVAAALSGTLALSVSLANVDDGDRWVSGVAFWLVPVLGLVFTFAAAFPARHDGVRRIGRRSSRALLAYTVPIALVGLGWSVAVADRLAFGVLQGLEFVSTVAWIALIGWIACVAVVALIRGPSGGSDD